MPGLDHASFKRRLALCIERFDSAKALANAAGIPQSTFFNYQQDGEPTRPRLVAIAHASKVPIAWLSAGEDSSQNPIEKSIHADAEYESGFQSRFKSWVEVNGGIEVVSTKSQISIDRLRQVFLGAELWRHELARLAKGLNAPIDYLLLGEPALNRGPTEEKHDTHDKDVGPAQTESDRSFLFRFHALVNLHGGPTEFSKTHDVDVATVKSILSGKRISIELLARLASQWKVPIRWLLSDQPAFHGDKAIENSSTTREFIARIEEIDDRRLFKGELTPNRGFEANPSWRQPVLRLLARIYEWLPPGNYDLHQLRIAVGPYASPGDVALVDPTAKVPETGFYLFKEKADKTGFAFLKNVSRTQEALREISGFQNDEPLRIPEEKFTCLGRVVVLIRKFNR